ncbi:Galactosamine-6-phosphate isomerase [Halanaerobium saccharolyticum subsp. saccharolyticum DSM 6643]|uniref:Galactosamine-6-phosphate isomerase n=1 Tax=Halanaerobium saccharolyticum subsp. saccharolyticum DSM 6643 TaxID=1293054 RepID=M5E4I3_9FIRM|nr:SIS domain-containing protein [Halanaerobium saccharolyticum]CCU80887.1 Galactosamine-6-phosphate isomerase [Halanaerobium saccharolyticum subsp. saccharolyticum DSM 6643]
MKRILGMTKEKWKEKNGIYTAEEIVQQPEMWRQTYKKVKEIKKDLINFYKKLMNMERLNIIFAGAGTSGFIGDSLTPYLKKKFPQFETASVHTTELVTHPEVYFNKKIPTLLISFARSGNSPESVAAIELAEEMVNDLYQLVITCNKEGKLAQKVSDSYNQLVLLPKKTNDRGFAMTSSYTSMLLTALLFFNIEELDKLNSTVELKAKAAEEIIDSFCDNKKLLEADFKKIIYLGDYSFFGVAKEASLKLLELTSGQIITRYDTPLGFRHGPKSIIDKDSLILFFLSDNEYNLKYEYDLLNELNKSKLGYKTAVITIKNRKKIKEKCDFYLSSYSKMDDEDEVFNTLEYIIYAQIISLYKSIHSGINPDNPSPDGSVNRVVQGVKIYPYKK